MELLELTEERNGWIKPLQAVWESSVRATHHFLQEKDIVGLRPAVQQGLAQVPRLAVVLVQQQPVGFIGAAEDKVEMLFIAPDQRGCGRGRQMMQFAMEQWGCTMVDVNEQNEQGVGFYQHLGFEVVGRSALDEQGNPFPILHLKHKESC